MLTTYNVISEDGFIAAIDGSEDFIPNESWLFTLNIIKQYDVVVMGRNSYEAIQNYDSELIEQLETIPTRKIVVTSNVDFLPKNGYEVIHDVRDMLSPDLNMLVTSGPTLNNYLFENNLIDKILFHKIPVKILKGIKPFKFDLDHPLEKISLEYI